MFHLKMFNPKSKTTVATSEIFLKICYSKHALEVWGQREKHSAYLLTAIAITLCFTSQSYSVIKTQYIWTPTRKISRAQQWQILSATPDGLEYKRTTLTVSTVATCTALSYRHQVICLLSPRHICTNIPG